MPFRAAESKAVSGAGTSFAVTSLLGGTRHNLAANTELVWWPGIENVSRAALVDAGGLTGGLDDPAPGALKSVVWYEEPLGLDVPDGLIRSALGQCPGAILSWNGSPQPSRKDGNSSAVREDQWTFTVIVPRIDAHHQRAFTGLTLLDAIEALLIDRGSVDTMLVSSPPIATAKRRRVNAGARVLRVRDRLLDVHRRPVARLHEPADRERPGL
jgi:hypothetical protein